MVVSVQPSLGLSYLHGHEPGMSLTQSTQPCPHLKIAYIEEVWGWNEVALSLDLTKMGVAADNSSLHDLITLGFAVHDAGSAAMIL